MGPADVAINPCTVLVVSRTCNDDGPPFRVARLNPSHVRYFGKVTVLSRLTSVAPMAAGIGA